MERPPALPAELVNEFVMKAHGDFERVQVLLESNPTLLNATWDWGGGDFKSAVGAAAHTGQKDIARYLLAKGARMDLYVAAMLGKLEVVKAIIEGFPEARHAKGAHGIPLIVHAQQGGDDAKAVVEYLKSLEDTAL